MDPVYNFGPFTLVPSQRTLFHSGATVRVGSRAFDILVVLVESAGKIVSNSQIFASVWGETVVEPGALRVHIAGLRKTLGDARSSQRYIVNVPLQGYCFVAPVSQGLLLNPGAAGNTVGTSATPAVQQLPALVSRPIGRAQVIAELLSELYTRRCVTLVGPGGMGKTTVAIAAASDFSAKSGVPAIFVNFAPLSDPALVPAALVAALGLPGLSAEPLRDAVAHVRERELLVVLDNCEHLIGPVANLAEALLNACPRVHVLTTSREPLRTQGEWVLRLRALRVPPEHPGMTIEELLDYSAVELFVERVRAVVDSFELTDFDVPLINSVCRSLDGIPLAIELAAARVEQVGLRRVAANLGNRLALLTRGRRTALPRHQTLRATLDWSYALLTEREMRLLQRVAVFRGRFSSASASAISECDEPELVEEALFSLVSKSLVATDINADHVQYWLLETTREYALAQLAASGNLQTVSRRHATHMLALVDSVDASEAGRGPDRERVPRVGLIDDLRAALRWCFGGNGDTALGTALVAVSAPVWFAGSRMAEHLSNIEVALGASGGGGPLEPRRLMALLESHGQSLWHIRGDGRAALKAFETAARLADDLGAHADALRIIWGMWLVTNSMGSYRDSFLLAERFGQIAAPLEDEGNALVYHRMMAMSLHLAGDHRRALTHARAVLAKIQHGGKSAGSNGHLFDHQVAALTTLTRILWALGQVDQALEHAESAIARSREVNHPLSLCFALSVGAVPVAIWCGDWARAVRYTQLLQENTSELSLSLWQAFAEGFQLVIARHMGDSNETLSSLRQPTRSLQDTLCTLDAGLADEAYFARGVAAAAGWTEPELLRIQGERCRQAENFSAAEAAFSQGLALARRQEALSWELRCATSLARLLTESSRLQEAEDCLASVLERFPAACHSEDLSAANALMKKLAALQAR